MDKEYLLKVFSENLVARKSYIQKNNLETYRLYNLEEYDLPLAVDIYLINLLGSEPAKPDSSPRCAARAVRSPGSYAVVHVFEEVPAAVLREVEVVLKELLKVEGVFFKNRVKGARKEEDGVKTAESGKNIVVNEYGHKFAINLSDYSDVGLFLDHRETRKWIASLSRGKVILNTFAYTGSFSVYAAKAGAAKTYSVDLSKTYCEWLKKNLKLNGLPPEKNWVYKMDTFEFFKYARRKELKFDIVIIDPPTFSRNKGTSFSVQKDHPRLINAALALLNPGGFVLFSTNFKDFRLNEDRLDSCDIREVTDGIPPDFAGGFPHVCFEIRRRKFDVE
ncbi:class I SAM-dependent methyltransferase [Candidatus Peregrinibacteria bacterium]|nr:class I SAM-dependent methyltransferase [Candidatus Peregrinibacteria bacterium]